MEQHRRQRRITCLMLWLLAGALLGPAGAGAAITASPDFVVAPFTTTLWAPGRRGGSRWAPGGPGAWPST